MGHPTAIPKDPEFLELIGIKIENTTVSNRNLHSSKNPFWVFADTQGSLTEDSNIPEVLHNVKQACFYRAASCTVQSNSPNFENAFIALKAPQSSHPSAAGLIAAARYGKGKVAVIADSDIFGDDYFDEFDHKQLWMNVLYWVSGSAFIEGKMHSVSKSTTGDASWVELKTTINELRELQTTSGSIEVPESTQLAAEKVGSIVESVEKLKPFYLHQADYLDQVIADFYSWKESGYGKPDFGKSLALFNPQLHRENLIRYLVVFPLYTPNASQDVKFESLLIQVPWPSWLATLENRQYKNEKFVPGHLVDFSLGYKSECAVLFPETVSLSGTATNNFGIIFCDREAGRYQKFVKLCCEILQVRLPPQLECFLSSIELIQDAFALWDLIHDRSHSKGELPFDPFMIRQKQPFWMYALEELRVDIASYMDAVHLSNNGFPFANYITYAVLFDRIFRFAITGARVKNYDALAGQILFSFLYKNNVLIWQDNVLSIDWETITEKVANLQSEIRTLYKGGSDMSKVAYWVAAHDLVSKYVKPNLASRWKSGVDGMISEDSPKEWISLIHDDEFPLALFHANLRKKVTSTIGEG